MKTIAISIDEDSLAALDRIAKEHRPGKHGPNRSEIVRRAVREFVARQGKLEREENDRRLLAAHRRRLEHEATVLVAEQSQP